MAAAQKLGASVLRDLRSEDGGHAGAAKPACGAAANTPARSRHQELRAGVVRGGGRRAVMNAPYIQASEREGVPGLPFEWGADPNLWLYRNRTLAMLYRFFRLSMEVGRLPSILGQEFFRNQVTSYHI